MKIISKGKSATKTQRVNCFNCKCVFEYNNSDIQTDRDGDYVNCPECISFIKVEKIFIVK